MGRAKRYYDVDGILAQLDDCAREYRFPMLDNLYVLLADVRLTAYREVRRWAIVIEVLGYNYPAGLPEGLGVDLYSFGNCLGRGGSPGFEGSVSVIDWEEVD